MNMFSSRVFWALVPKFIRKGIFRKKLPVNIVDYYESQPKPLSAEIRSVLDYLKTNPLAIFPYPFQHRYSESDIEVYDDEEKSLRYVFLDGKRLYFKRKWSKKEIKRRFNWLLIEQDTHSPHRYLTDRFRFEDGEVLIDVGAAEGNFALGLAEKASRIIIFETNKEWIEPLQATFEPWKDKVQIVKKFVSDYTSSSHTTLDDFFTHDEPRALFLKIDVEGAETKLLKGSEKLLSRKDPLKLAICTYHKQDDEKHFTTFLRKRDFDTHCSDGYMIFYLDKTIKAPYLRRGLVRAEKNKSKTVVG